ncbi:MAG: prepilin-type N-terminal cleavage/methylation domain-containing protein [Rickettsiales bacterium]|nr:prepilin-type N-terminal cleavage/methylation domain-containing protein [Rickettsiales bacterium]
MMTSSQSQGFSLLELSIVLVIIGLLASGVMVGQSLVRGAEMRSIVTDYNKFLSAINGFRDKYNAVPGDMRNAFAFWGAACGTNATTVSTGCNGDGDGAIESNQNGESLKAWEHLSRAGLIEGSFDGTAVFSASTPTVTQANIAEGKFPSSAWNIGTLPVEAAFVMDTMPGRQWLAIGSVGPTATDGWVDGLVALTNSDAWSLDKKMDNGNLGSGVVGVSDSPSDCNDTGSDGCAMLLLVK